MLGLAAYVLWLGKGINGGADSFKLASSAPLYGTAGQGVNQIFAGGRATIKIGNDYHTWTHIGYPSTIYHAQSSDLYNWTSDPTPVVAYTSTMFGLTDCNQAADTSVIEYNGSIYLFYDGADNSNFGGAIGYSKYPYSLSNYSECYPNLFTPTATPTITPTLFVPTPYMTATATIISTPYLCDLGQKTVNENTLRYLKWQKLPDVLQPNYVISYGLTTTAMTAHEYIANDMSESASPDLFVYPLNGLKVSGTYHIQLQINTTNPATTIDSNIITVSPNATPLP